MPKPITPELMAEMLVRALLLNTDAKRNEAHKDAPCPAVLWEDEYNLDLEKLNDTKKI